MPAAIVALAATLIAAGAWVVDGAGASALDWSVYDRWLRGRNPGPGAPAPGNPALVVVVRDPASEARFGTGSWDRAVLARLVGNLARAGAATIGVDVPLGAPSPPGRGGAASDALLSEATAQAGAVVYPIALELTYARPAGGSEPGPGASPAPVPHRSWLSVSPAAPAFPEASPLRAPLPGLAQHAKSVGHTLAPADADGVVRRVPLFVRLEDRVVPALGLALAAAFLNTGPDSGALRLPVDAQGRALIAFAGAGLPRGARVVPFHELWTAIEAGRLDRIQGLVDDRLVLVLAEPARGQARTPLGPMSDVVIQAHLLGALMTGAGLTQAPPAWALLGTLLLAALAAWLWLALPWWVGLGGAAVLTAGYVASLPLALERAGLVLPVWLPLAAAAMASAGALVWSHFASARHLRQLEGDNARAREALARHESAVETLEEDLEAARATVARSTGAERDLVRAAEALRAQLAEARVQEQETRRRLQELEGELRGLRPAEGRQGRLDDAEQEDLRRECERMGIVTRDHGVLAAFRDLKKAARASLPILLLGEPGTGKELFARASHRLSPRAGGPFVAVNMAAISPELFESELFGHVRGSFTGAVGDRKGYFEQADRGTIFLDEVGELRPEHQSKLLRVLQDRTFYRVGATRPSAVDVRVVSASNRDLERGVEEGWFREDLYFRLKGMVLRLPALRERPADLPLLADRLVADAAAELGRDGVALSEEAVLALQSHEWPGNVRELQHCLRQAVTLAEGALLRREDLRLPARAPASASGPAEPGTDSGSDAAVLACLRRHGFDMQATARALGWDRSTVTQRLKGLGFRALVESGGDRSGAALALAGDPALARTVEVKLREYHEHLLRSVHGFDSSDAAVAACRRRFKNLPERHFRSLESLVRQHFERRPPTAAV